MIQGARWSRHSIGLVTSNPDLTEQIRIASHIALAILIVDMPESRRSDTLMLSSLTVFALDGLCVGQECRSFCSIPLSTINCESLASLSRNEQTAHLIHTILQHVPLPTVSRYHHVLPILSTRSSVRNHYKKCTHYIDLVSTPRPYSP